MRGTLLFALVSSLRVAVALRVSPPLVGATQFPLHALTCNHRPLRLVTCPRCSEDLDAPPQPPTAPRLLALRGGDAPAPRGALRGVLDDILGFIDRRYFIVGVVLAVALAYLFPTVGLKGGMLRPEISVSWAAPCGIFLISGFTMPTSQLADAAFRWRTHLGLQAFNMGVLPLAMLGYASALSGLGVLERGLCDGLLVMSALPTTVNMCVALTRAAKGNEAIAIFNAVLGNLLGIVVSPFLLLILVGKTGALPFADACISLCKKVLLPLLVGQLARPVLSTALKSRKKALSRTSESLLLLTVFCTFCKTFSDGFGVPALTLAWLFLIVTFSHATALGSAWLVSSRLAAKDRVAFLFASTQKTLALGLPLLQIVFQGRADLAVLCTPLLIQHPLQLLVGSLLTERLAKTVEAV